MDAKQKDSKKFNKEQKAALIKLANRNIKSMAKLISITCDPTDLVHLTNRELRPTALLDRSKEFTSWMPDPYFNPQGLWVSCGGSWANYVISNYPKDSIDEKLVEFLYVIKIVDTTRVPFIETVKQMDTFFDPYLKRGHKDLVGTAHVFDWNRIKKDYDGLVICPYLG